MESCDEDMFAFSDEELPILTPKCNPVKEHLIKELSNVQCRIQKTKNDIKDVQNMTKRVLKSLYSEAQYGEDITTDSDSDLYTIDGQPLVKKRKEYKVHEPKQTLIVRSSWKRVVCNQWVIGIVLQNISANMLNNIQIYVSFKDEEDLNGISMFWYLKNETFWSLTETIMPHKEVIAAVALDLPKFDKNPFCDVYGTVTHEIDGKQYQTPIPVTHLTIEQTIDNRYSITFSSHLNESILALKTSAAEKTVRIQIQKNPERGVQLMRFLKEKFFKEISADVYVVQAAGCLMYCLVEILLIIGGEVKLKIFSRSRQQMNIITRLLKDQFPDIIIEDEPNSVQAAMALIKELNLYFEYASSTKCQVARIGTDLLIQ